MTTCSSRGSVTGAIDASPRTVTVASSRPPSAPPAPSSRLSVSNCLAMRARPAPRAARSDELAPPRDRARQQQVGDVGARNQQHEPDGGEQDEKGRPHVAAQGVAHRRDRNGAGLVIGWMLPAQLLADAVHLGRRAVDGDARLQLGQGVNGPAAAAAIRLIVADRHPDLGGRVEEPLGVERLERSGHDAEDAERPVLQRDGAAHDRRIGAEAAAPQAIAEQRDAPAVLAIVLRREAAAESRPHTQEVEVVPAHANGRQPFRLRRCSPASASTIESSRTARSCGSVRASPRRSRVRHPTRNRQACCRQS